MSSQRYLADTAAAAAAVGDFVRVLEDVGPVARPRTLRAVAPRLEEPLARARAMAARLDAQRLDDRRLEEQRQAASEALGRVVGAMQAVSGAAAAGDPAATQSAARALASAIARLRGLPEAS